MESTLSPVSTAVAAARTAPAVVLHGLSHRYGERIALRDVSFEVPSGEIFGLLGPNGSGKSTLFGVLSTLIRAAAGEAEVAGVSVRSDADGVRRKIGVVFQEPSVDLKLTALENLTHQGHLYGLRGSALRKRALEMLERVGLTDRRADLVERFSGGMRRRLEVAKGLLHHPSVLLLDEPTNGLDPGARMNLWKHLDLLRRTEGVTVLVTTHLMEEAERCDRLALLHEGSLVALGTPEELKRSIGGDVVRLRSAEPQLLQRELQARFSVRGHLLGDTVRLAMPDGHHFASEAVDAFRELIESIAVSRPTLEDVFIAKTGHRFWNDVAVTEGEE